MIHTIEIAPSILSAALAEYLAARVDDFVTLEWSGNQYTGEGSEYPVVDQKELSRIINAYLVKK